MVQPGGEVHQDYEEKKVQGEKARGEARLNARDHAESAEDEAGTHEVGPEEMPRNPARHERGDELRGGEMFGAESCERHGVEKRAEEDQLVEAACFLPIAGKKNHAEADDKNRSTDRVAPDYGVGNCEGHECGGICEAAGHSDSFLRGCARRKSCPQEMSSSITKEGVRARIGRRRTVRLSGCAGHGMRFARRIRCAGEARNREELLDLVLRRICSSDLLTGN